MYPGRSEQSLHPLPPDPRSLPRDRTPFPRHTRVPSIAIAICTCSRPTDLAQTLRTVLAEPLASQIIISSDGIDIETDVLMVEARRSDTRVTLQRGPRLGQAANKNACVDVCETDLILFLEDGSTLASDFIRFALPSATDDVIIASAATASDSRIFQPSSGPTHWLPVASLPPQAFAVPGAIFPVNFLRASPFHESYSHGGEILDLALSAEVSGITIRSISFDDLSGIDRLLRGVDMQAHNRGLLCGLQHYVSSSTTKRRSKRDSGRSAALLFFLLFLSFRVD
jgi:hypothetical protein